MKAYLGTKLVQAEPMDQWTAFRAGFARGTLIILPEGKGPEGYKVVADDGYVSWSPKAVFERCYRELTPGEATLIAAADPTA
jgi:hypothetical protein